MSKSSREVIKLMKNDGWKFPHPVKDYPKGTYEAILKQAGLK